MVTAFRVSLSISLLFLVFLLHPSQSRPSPQIAEARILEIKDEKTRKLIHDSFTSGKSVLYESLFPNINLSNLQVGQPIFETNIEVESPTLVIQDSKVQRQSSSSNEDESRSGSGGEKKTFDGVTTDLI